MLEASDISDDIMEESIGMEDDIIELAIGADEDIIDESMGADEDMVELSIGAEDDMSIVDEDDWAKALDASTTDRAVPAMSRRIIVLSIWGARRAGSERQLVERQGVPGFQCRLQE